VTARIHVVQTGQTTWEADKRFESPNGSPLTDVGIRTVQTIACELVTEEIVAIYAGDAEAEQQTADILTQELGLKVQFRPDLRDLNYGLWQGLTVDEIKRRQPKLYKQWTESPATACPPGGEAPFDASQRLRAALKAVIKRRKNASIALVARPTIVGVLRCLLTETDLDALWTLVDTGFTWTSFELAPDVLA